MRLRGLSPLCIGSLITRSMRRSRRDVKVFLSICDHYEPMWGAPPSHVEDERVDRWVNEYPEMAKGLEDSRGRSPQHTFFYPAEEYNPKHLDKLADLCRRGHGDVDVHLHRR